jgi:hypothetical protein
VRTFLSLFCMAYVIDPFESFGYLFRAPRFLAQAFCWWHARCRAVDSRVTGCWHYAYSPDGD